MLICLITETGLYSRFSLGLWCLTPCSTILQLLAVSFIGGGNQGTRRKPVIEQLYHIILHRVHLAMTGATTQNFSGDRY